MNLHWYKKCIYKSGDDQSSHQLSTKIKQAQNNWKNELKRIETMVARIYINAKVIIHMLNFRNGYTIVERCYVVACSFFFVRNLVCSSFFSRHIYHFFSVELKINNDSLIEYVSPILICLHNTKLYEESSLMQNRIHH